MVTIREIHSGETVKTDGTTREGGDPVLFETVDAAAAWAVDRFGLDAGKEYRIELVSA